MSESLPTATTAYAPAGFCPRCGFRTDPGVCPDCGQNNRRISKRNPASRACRWLRRLTIFAVGATAIATSLWVARITAPRWMPHWLVIRFEERFQRTSFGREMQAIRMSRAGQLSLDGPTLERELRAAILAASPDHPWAGIYSGWQGNFFISPDHRALWQGGSGGYEADGRVVIQDGRSIDIWIDRSWRGESSIELVMLRCDGELAVTPRYRLPWLLNAPADEPGASYLFCFRSNSPSSSFNERVAQRSWPALTLPAIYKAQQLRRPLRARVTRILSSGQMWPSTQPSPPVAYQLKAELNVGAAAGVFIGLDFWACEPGFRATFNDFPTAHVYEVHENTCLVEGAVFADTATLAPCAGMQFRTGRVDANIQFVEEVR